MGVIEGEQSNGKRTELGGAQKAERAHDGWKSALQAMFPTIPEMWGLPAPKPVLSGGLVNTAAFNLASPADRTTTGGASWPSGSENISASDKAKLVGFGQVLARHSAAKALAKGIASADPESEQAKWREEQKKLMPLEVTQLYAAQAT